MFTLVTLGSSMVTAFLKPTCSYYSALISLYFQEFHALDRLVQYFGARCRNSAAVRGEDNAAADLFFNKISEVHD